MQTLFLRNMTPFKLLSSSRSRCTVHGYSPFIGMHIIFAFVVAINGSQVQHLDVSNSGCLHAISSLAHSYTTASEIIKKQLECSSKIVICKIKLLFFVSIVIIVQLDTVSYTCACCGCSVIHSCIRQCRCNLSNQLQLICPQHGCTCKWFEGHCYFIQP